MPYSKAFETAVNELYETIHKYRLGKYATAVSGVLLLVLPESPDPMYGAIAGSYDANKNIRTDFTRVMFKLFCLTLAKMKVPMLELHAEVDTAYATVEEDDNVPT